MEKNLNEQTEVINVQATEVDKEAGTKVNEVSLGKFKDVNALLKAYNSLEAEFTKRSQRLKELEEFIKPTEKVIKEDGSNVNEKPFIEETPVKKAESVKIEEKEKSITLEDKEKILKEYLKEILSSKSKAIVLGEEGIGLKTPTSKPKTIDEAGSLAKEFLATKLK